MSHDDFWDRLSKVNAGMLDAKDGARLVPMSHYADAAAKTLWFITAAGTDPVESAQGGPVAASYVVADGSKGIYAHVKGTMALSDDKAKLDELWNPIADSWFEGGKTDPELRLLSFAVTGGDVWLTPTSGLWFMFQVAKAQLTDGQPDMGTHFTL